MIGERAFTRPRRRKSFNLWSRDLDRAEVEGVEILPDSLSSLSSVHYGGSPLVNPDQKPEGLERLWCVQVRLPSSARWRAVQGEGQREWTRRGKQKSLLELSQSNYQFKFSPLSLHWKKILNILNGKQKWKKWNVFSCWRKSLHPALSIIQDI